MGRETQVWKPGHGVSAAIPAILSIFPTRRCTSLLWPLITYGPIAFASSRQNFAGKLLMGSAHNHPRCWVSPLFLATSGLLAPYKQIPPGPRADPCSNQQQEAKHHIASSTRSKAEPHWLKKDSGHAGTKLGMSRTNPL